MKEPDTFCALGITNQDLYSTKCNFVFGLANREHASGVFSFCRFKPDYPGNEGLGGNLVQKVCYVVAHEISHMFGLKHCIYYECLMNGTNSAQELARKHSHTICLVCLKKLKINLKFDTKVWLE